MTNIITPKPQPPMPNPNHIAIIMDGNGRWAKQNSKSTKEGHRRGAERAKETIKLCLEKRISFLTLYAFSSENWSRPKDEVTDIIDLLRFYLSDDAEALIKKNIAIKFIGDISAFPNDVQIRAKNIEDKSSASPKLSVNIALNYGSKQEITNAVKALISGNIEASIEAIESNLYTAKIPDPDLLIRTGGEKRLSNFLLWQSAYTELYFCDVLWPDFNKEEFEKAIEDFSNRERRFGGR
ncbi:MAG: polyprenyl diphosphate synthase [Rickettsiales bacterium]|nr:polyprenyl diphosphate synthase [Rickettsiales bacterium]